jgi:hypothetical protein
LIKIFLLGVGTMFFGDPQGNSLRASQKIIVQLLQHLQIIQNLFNLAKKLFYAPHRQRKVKKKNCILQRFLEKYFFTQNLRKKREKPLYIVFSYFFAVYFNIIYVMLIFKSKIKNVKIVLF